MNGLHFYLSRNTETYGGCYTLTCYRPKRNPQYDRVEWSGGRVVGQLEAGSWMYWMKEDEPSFSYNPDRREAESLLQGQTLALGECIDLTTGERFMLMDAEDYNVCCVTRRKAE